MLLYAAIDKYFNKKNIGEQIIYENHNNYKRKKILDTKFDYIEVCIKNQKNEDIIMTDLYQLSFYVS